MRPIKSNVNRIVTRPYQTLRTPWAFHLDHMIDGTVPKSNPTSTMDPTVFKLNRKPSHKDIKMSLIVAEYNSKERKQDRKEQKCLYLLLNSLYPIQPTIHTIPQLYILYFLHRGPLHRLHFPQPLSVAFWPWSSVKSTVNPFLWTFGILSSRLFLIS